MNNEWGCLSWNKETTGLAVWLETLVFLFNKNQKCIANIYIYFFQLKIILSEPLYYHTVNTVYILDKSNLYLLNATASLSPCFLIYCAIVTKMKIHFDATT